MNGLWRIGFLSFIFGTTAVSAQNIDCRRLPPFTQTTGFDVRRLGFSTSERTIIGLVLLEIPQSADEKSKTYQHPSWKTAGSLGPLVLTETGLIYVAPIPSINLLHNKPEAQNRIYTVHPQTQEMETSLSLPPKHPASKENPFGIMGLGYDCATKVLYATSIMGSTQDQAHGRIFAIRTDSMKVLNYLEGWDGMGVGVGTINGEKRVYFGDARSGDVLSIGLEADGRLKEDRRFELSLEGLGPRGDDRARKIRFSQDNALIVQGISFYYNLIAPTEKQETSYTFRFNPSANRWALVGIQ